MKCLSHEACDLVWSEMMTCLFIMICGDWGHISGEGLARHPADAVKHAGGSLMLSTNFSLFFSLTYPFFTWFPLFWSLFSFQDADSRFYQGQIYLHKRDFHLVQLGVF